LWMHIIEQEPCQLDFLKKFFYFWFIRSNTFSKRWVFSHLIG